jgi:outer membrane protein assembly factor BamD (BamD/ComL family)
MKRLMASAMVLVALTGLMWACSADKGKELFETAQFEEKQNNREHARQLYQEIVTKYPGSPLAKQAAERLAALGGKPD